MSGGRVFSVSSTAQINNYLCIYHYVVLGMEWLITVATYFFFSEKMGRLSSAQVVLGIYVVLKSVPWYILVPTLVSLDVTSKKQKKQQRILLPCEMLPKLSG